VGFGAGLYLVAWSENEDVYGQRVDTAGQLVGSAFPICTVTGRQSVSWVVSDSTDFLVVWDDRRGGREVYGQLVSSSGALIGGEIRISQEGGRDSAAACDGTNYLVTFVLTSNATDVYGQLVSTSGTPVGTNFAIDVNGYQSDNVGGTVFDGSKYVVVFPDQLDWPDSDSWDVCARCVWPSGDVDSNRYSIAVSTNAENFAGVARDGTNILITALVGRTEPFDTNTCVRGRFFDTELNPTTPWFTICGALGTNEFPLIGVPVRGEGQFLTTIPTVSADFDFLNVYGRIVDPNPPQINGIEMTAGAVELDVGDLFLGASNVVERCVCLTAAVWQAQGTFVSDGPQTNWSEGAASGLDNAYYRLRWE
jgi:hypothetical protein